MLETGFRASLKMPRATKVSGLPTSCMGEVRMIEDWWLLMLGPVLS